MIENAKLWEMCGHENKRTANPGKQMATGLSK